MATREPDVITLLKKDHAEVKALFKQFADSEAENEQHRLADRICKMLAIHATCEEELLYPAAHDALADAEEDEELVHEAEVEHATAKQLIAEIESMSAADEKFGATVKVLCEYINHHVKEEEGELFPKLKKSELDLQQIGSEFLTRKAELMSQIGLQEPDQPSLSTRRAISSRRPTRSGASKKKTRSSSGRYAARAAQR
jgi:hemerythrin superfamily protein